jgi:phosphoribosylaminoimidazole-succinocarboxamide synthase
MATTFEKLYEGKAKILYPTEQPGILRTYFKDDATAFNAQKKGSIQGKGAVNCAIAAHLFKQLEAKGIPTHFVSKLSDTEMLVKAVTIIPLEVVVRNIAAGSLCKQTGIALGTVLPQPLVEFFYKDDALGDPLLTPDRLALMQVASGAEVEQLKQLAQQINALLQDFFNQCGITLVDFKLEFGRAEEGKIILADEISPDTCRLWNQAESDPTARVLDKDRFRQDLGGVESAYQQVMQRVLAQPL